MCCSLQSRQPAQGVAVVGVAVSVGVLGGRRVSVAVGTSVCVGVKVGVRDGGGVSVRVTVGVNVDVGVMVGVGDVVTVGLGVAEGVHDAVSVRLGKTVIWVPCVGIGPNVTTAVGPPGVGVRVINCKSVGVAR